MSESGPVLIAESLTRVFATDAGDVRAVVDVSLSLAPGELVVIRGASGSGKSTLLTLLAGIERPTSGRVLLEGRDLAGLSEAELVDVRRRRIGYVFQSFGLIPILSAAENVEIPLRTLATDPAERVARVDEVLRLLGMAGHAHHRPEELSGGQQQRVAIARALAHRPSLLLADEPTGQLDAETATGVMDLFSRLVHQDGTAALVATHDPLLVERADRVLDLRGGRL